MEFENTLFSHLSPPRNQYDGDELIRPQATFAAVNDVLRRIKTQLGPVEPNSHELARLSEIQAVLPDIPQLAARVLSRRSIEITQITDFLSPERIALPNPIEMKNCSAGVDLLLAAMRLGAPIAINGDFDVDGEVSAALMAITLDRLGVPVVMIQHDRFRHEYGIHREIIDRATQSGAKLAIFLDHGTSSFNALQYAQGKIATLVIDHHTLSPQGAPPADVFINPANPACQFAAKSLCAAGVTYFFLRALVDKLHQLSPHNSADRFNPDTLLDLVALATIADVVDLNSPINRLLVKRGLDKSRSAPSVCLKELYGRLTSESDIDTETNGYGVAPVINALSRLVTSEPRFQLPTLALGEESGSQLGVKLLTAESPDQAASLAALAIQVNEARKATQANVIDICYKRLKKLEVIPAAVVMLDRRFHLGVVGPACSELGRQLCRPIGLFGVERTGRPRGSLRGVIGFDVYKALLNCSHLLDSFGGHTAAGGCTVKLGRFEEFQHTFCQEAERQLGRTGAHFTMTPDLALSLAELKARESELIETLRILAPFGNGNPAPQILIRGLTVESVRSLRGRHFIGVFSAASLSLSAAWWHLAEHPAICRAIPGLDGRLIALKGASVDLLVSPSLRFTKQSPRIDWSIQAAFSPLA